jgi:hypothetical protein
MLPSAEEPDWLRLGSDIIDGVTPPTFNMTFSSSGQTVPKAGVPGKAPHRPTAGSTLLYEVAPVVRIPLCHRVALFVYRACNSCCVVETRRSRSGTPAVASSVPSSNMLNKMESFITLSRRRASCSILARLECDIRNALSRTRLVLD